MVRIGTLALLLSLSVPAAWSAQVAELTPQGEVSVVKSVKMTFDTPVIALGDAQAAAPAQVVCDQPGIEGDGRWIDSKRWTYVFRNDLGPGVRCSVKVDPSFRTLASQALKGPAEFSFQTGGPQVRRIRPHGSSDIEEEQAFLLRFNGAVTTDSLLEHTTCLVEGLGEAVPVRLISGSERDAILQAASVDKAERNASTQILQCKRRLPADAKIQLRVGPGIASQSGIVTTQAEIFKYKVRPPFTASFSCQRENAHSPCTPILPISVTFSAPISAADAQKIRLEIPGGERLPAQDENATYPDSITYVKFIGPFPESADLKLVLPPGLKDDSGRALSNAGEFPLATHTAAFPPLVKFAKAPFGVIERFANQPAGGSEDDYPPSVPLTVRNVEAELQTKELSVSAGKVGDYVTQDDLQVLHWYARLDRLDETSRTRAQLDAIMADRRAPQPRRDDVYIDTRGFSALKGQPNTRQLTLPGVGKSALRPFEVIGVPMQEPGFHVIEVESARLGKSLIESQVPMYVRSSALVTNLGVHIKRGRDDVLAWVTTLDQGKVVPDATIHVLDCSGELVLTGKTDKDGIWHSRQALQEPGHCNEGIDGFYVSARIPADHPLARGKADFAFALTNWDQGIESWRFNVPTDTSPKPSTVVRTVFDRSLFRAGETVSMKHFIRIETRDGLALPKDLNDLPDRVLIEHQGSGQRYQLPLAWKTTGSGGLDAFSRFDIPKTAKLGMYSVTLTNANNDWLGSSTFRVEEFKLPVLTGSLKISDKSGSSLLIAPKSLSADVQISYVSGGPAGKLPVSVSGVVRDKWVNFDDYQDYSFNLPDDADSESGDESGEDSGEDSSDSQPSASADTAQALFLNKEPLTLDAQGGARLALASVPEIDRPRDLLFEASFADPNGEIQTLSQTVPVWPAGVLAGIRTGSWVQQGEASKISVVAVSPAGEPQANVQVSVAARSRTLYSSRKRMVGGFYSYDSHAETHDLGTVCQGTTNDKGLLSCSIQLKQSGSIQLRATVKDPQGRESSAMSTVWVVGGDELWFGGANDDRMDLIPEKKTYKPGETASFQVRMPFRQATALVAIEREGVLSTQVVTLKGTDPTIRIPVEAQWGPNVYVSVLALRGRLREVPWYSFFIWGWRQPTAWYDAYTSMAKAYAAPTPFVDLSKPAFRFGVSEIQVSDNRDQLMVKVSTDKKTYQVRGKATVTVQVTLPDGKPAANGQFAFAAVDQALLELSPNDSWNLLGAMRRHRSYGVQTSTAQMQIVGRRHYGRKALPSGGGGGKSPTRELLDTLLLWKPAVRLDENGKAQITVPLNDSITRFKLVAIADYGVSRFGTGSAQISVTQDLQAISGLPALVREGDRYQAMVTVRNSTERNMRVQVDAGYSGKGVPAGTLPAQTVEVAAGAAHTLTWEAVAPEGNLLDNATTLKWQIGAHELGAQGTAAALASDRLSIKQSLIPSVPITARQATLMAVDGSKPPVSLPVAVPKGALSDANGRARGGLEINLQSSLAGGLPGVKHWFAVYPYTCLEQLSSKAIGMRSPAQWQAIMKQLPDYLDSDGLAGYFPGVRQGSEVLTAYILAASNEAQALGLAFALPADAKKSMTQGLLAFAQGKIVRHRWAPQKDLDVRKLLVLEALSREGLVNARMLDSITIAPNRWPTSAVIDWLALLQRVRGIPNQAAQIKQARQIIQGRLLSRGTELAFADDAQNNWWWLMGSTEVNAAKLMLTAIGQPGWDEDMPRIAQGLLRMQSRGAWRTTTANLMSSLAFEKFAQHYERTAVAGQIRVYLGSDGSAKAQSFDWDKAKQADGVRSGRLFQPWPKSGADELIIEQQGQGQGWASVRAMAAVAITQPVMSGYRVQRKITPVSQAMPGIWSRGDVYRVDLDIESKTPTVWAVLSDPVPSGATILGSGLGRDSAIATRQESSDYWGPSFIERKFDVYRAYYEYLPQGKTHVQYTVRLNTVGKFQLPPTRIEAMYQPDVFGEFPNNNGLKVEPVKSK